MSADGVQVTEVCSSHVAESSSDLKSLPGPHRICFSGRGDYFLLHGYHVEGWEPGHAGDKDLMNTYEKKRFRPLSSMLP